MVWRVDTLTDPLKKATVVEVVVLDASERQAILVHPVTALRRGRWDGLRGRVGGGEGGGGEGGEGGG